MSKITLVTGSDTLTGRKLIEKLLHRDTHVIAPIQSNTKDIMNSNTSNLTTLTWNRFSWFSTKSMIREILQNHKTINAALILHSHAVFEKDFQEAPCNEIDNVMDYSIKGNVILMRELIPMLEASSGFLGMVIPHRSNWKTGPLHSLTDGAFAEFSKSIIHDLNSDIWSCGFHSRSSDVDKFCSEIIQAIRDKPRKLQNKWLLHTDGKKPFGGVTIKESIR